MERKRMIEGDRVFLRYLEPGDAQNMLDGYNDPDVRRYLGTKQEPMSLEMEMEFARDAAEKMKNPYSTDFVFAIVVKENGKHIGNVDVKGIDWDAGRGELGIVIFDKNYWDKGHGGEAITCIARHMFLKRRLHRLQLEVNSHNERAKACYERIGFKVEGVKREALFFEGKFVDVIVMGLLSHEFMSSLGKH